MADRLILVGIHEEALVEEQECFKFTIPFRRRCWCYQCYQEYKVVCLANQSGSYESVRFRSFNGSTVEHCHLKFPPHRRVEAVLATSQWQIDGRPWNEFEAEGIIARIVSIQAGLVLTDEEPIGLFGDAELVIVLTTTS